MSRQFVLHTKGLYIGVHCGLYPLLIAGVKRFRQLLHQLSPADSHVRQIIQKLRAYLAHMVTQDGQVSLVISHADSLALHGCQEFADAVLGVLSPLAERVDAKGRLRRLLGVVKRLDDLVTGFRRDIRKLLSRRLLITHGLDGVLCIFVKLGDGVSKSLCRLCSSLRFFARLGVAVLDLFEPCRRIVKLRLGRGKIVISGGNTVPCLGDSGL